MLWLLHAQAVLDDDELCQILTPASLRRNRARALKAMWGRRARANEWWEARCEAYIATYEANGIERDRWPIWLRDP